MYSEMEDKVIEVLIKHINSSLSREDIGVKDDLIEIGLNSLNFMEVVIDLESEFDIEFDEMAIAEEFDTVEKFIAYIKENE